MKATPLAAIAAFCLAALCALAPATASAQGRDNVFAVAGVRVDETAANGAAAQQAGFAAAQRRAFDRLIARLTIPEEWATRTMPALDPGAIERMVLSVDVEEERRSATRYIGRLTVRFDPSQVRAYLRNGNLTVIDTRTAPVLVAPVAPDAPEETATLWRQVWAQGGYEGELAPLVTAPAELTGDPSWPMSLPYAQAAQAASSLYATLRVRGSTASATLVEIDSNARRERGTLTAQITGNDLRAALTSLADQANTRIQNEWKARVATASGQRARVSASALYSDQRQWEQIKSALEGAAQTQISEIRIEAVGRQGALVSFSFVGARAALAADLARRGVRLEDTAMGPTLRTTSGR